MCGCESWSVSLRKEHTLKMFINRYLEKYLSLRGEEKIGGWRKLLREEFIICTVQYVVGC